jgi:hypothetical protein
VSDEARDEDDFDGGTAVFVQVMEGRASDAEAMKQLMERWGRELRPGAKGFLGSTAGVTADGRAIAFARFESAEAAQANSDRPEQGQWWAEMEACYEGEATFANSEDIEEFMAGGSDDAGFVQVMKGQGLDRDTVARMDEKLGELAPTARPDIIGGFRVWTGPDSAYDVTFFTSEADARAGEAKGLPAELGELAGEYEKLLGGIEFFDLTDPWLA